MSNGTCEDQFVKIFQEMEVLIGIVGESDAVTDIAKAEAVLKLMQMITKMMKLHAHLKEQGVK